MQKLTTKNVKEKLDEGHEQVCFIDVRSQDEFASGHPTGAICMPLDEIERDHSKIPKDKLVILSCQSGKRSARAQEVLRERGFTNVTEMEGGFSAWSAAGLPVNKFRNTLPIFRQVLITAGLFVLTGTILALTIDIRFLALPLFMGAGLTFAGTTGWCGMALLLERMPWNRS